MGVVPRGAARTEPPFRHPDLLVVDLNLGSGGKHWDLSWDAIPAPKGRVSAKWVQGTKP
ncbi:hypothetical protein TM239_36710 [Bradyrhizobium sp. TM239]|nr:hypothetical protein TM239_36710 [Bradyrhizobium sp. TM239]